MKFTRLTPVYLLEAALVSIAFLSWFSKSNGLTASVWIQEVFLQPTFDRCATFWPILLVPAVFHYFASLDAFSPGLLTLPFYDILFIYLTIPALHLIKWILWAVITMILDGSVWTLIGLVIVFSIIGWIANLFSGGGDDYTIFIFRNK